MEQEDIIINGKVIGVMKRSKRKAVKQLAMKDKRGIKTRYRASIIISIVIVIVTFAGLIKINNFNKDYRYSAQRGILNIEEWDMQNTIPLNGEWEFYPNVLLEPKDINTEQFKEHKKNMRYIKVPGEWNSSLNKDASSVGSGTYRLRIKVPKNTAYGIKTKTIRSSSKIYLNEHEIIQVGKPALEIEDFESESKYRVGGGHTLDKEIEILVQVSNYNFASGGMLKAIEFGTFQTIIKTNKKDYAVDMLIISIYLVLGIYFAISYLQRKKEIYLLYFSLMNLAMGLYQSTLNEQVLDLLFTYNFAIRTRVQIVGMIVTALCMLRFTHHLFTQYSNKKTVKIISTINITVLIIAVIIDFEKFSANIFNLIPAILSVGYITGYIYVIYILFKAIFNNEDSLEYIFIITTSLLLYWILMVLKIFLEIDIEKLQVMLNILMIGSTVGLISHRSQLDYMKANDLAEKLIQQNKLKDEFLANASHELRTPLQVILNLTENLLEGKKGTLNLKQQESLLFIHQEGQRLIRLVWDLLDASRIKKGELILKLGLVKPYAITDEILREMKLLVPSEKSITFENKMDKNFPPVYADTDKFRQIIYNLVHNAIKYTRQGEILVLGEVVSGYAKITVKDTGIGIEDKHHKEIFDTFYRVNNENYIEQGLGLGLSISRYLVEAQGGTISVDSIYGKGSSFSFTLPLYNQNEEESGIVQLDTQTDLKLKEKREDKTRQNGPEILIVDDELENQQVLKNMLNELNVNTRVTSNGGEALEIIQKNKIDLVIVDFLLPDMCGSELCKEIRREYSMVELPIILLTASGKIAGDINIFKYGINDFHRKPVHLVELRSRVQSLLKIKTTVEEGLEREFQYFQSQISPHFLYNTINTIIGLSYTDSEKTRKALNNLSIYFRGKLDIHKKVGFITLQSELELIKAYLEIEELRFGERLTVEYDIEENLRAMIPPLTLQPIVENSVCHGIAPRGENGIIKITAREKPEGFVQITIEDNGMGMSKEKQEEILGGNAQGIGCTNVIEKINMIKNASLTLESDLGKGTRVTITIPESKQNERNHFM